MIRHIASRRTAARFHHLRRWLTYSAVSIALGLVVAGCSTAAPAPSTAPLTTPPMTAAATELASVPTPRASTPAPAETEVYAVAGSATPDARTAAEAAPMARPPAPVDPGTGEALTITGADTNNRLQIALTFDAGEDRGFAPDILDMLREEGISATFGMTGVWAEAHPDLVQRMVAEGHQLINHSYDHSSFTGNSTGGAPLGFDQIAFQLAETEQIVGEITGGYAMKPYFRFPYGDYDEQALSSIAELGYYLNIFWTCDSYGWKLGVTGADVARRCTTEALPHEITLLHVGAAAVADYEGLPMLIDWYRQQGYEFVTVEQMLQP